MNAPRAGVYTTSLLVPCSHLPFTLHHYRIMSGLADDLLADLEGLSEGEEEQQDDQGTLWSLT